ncbi:MAG: 50S ribosomal protein L3 [Planctomycetota bacterium]
MPPKFLMGRKRGMTQVFLPDGRCVPVTVLDAGPCPVVQVKTQQTDGYSALQIGFHPQRASRLSKPVVGHFKKANVPTHHYLREVRLKQDPEQKVGEQLGVDVFQVGDIVDVIGTNKGHGFQGVVTVWNFKGKRQTHGNMNQRGPGSIGMHSEPARTLKGKRMATRWGNERITVKIVEVVAIDPANNRMLLKGSVPGWRNGVLLVRAAKTPKPKPQKPKEEPKKK